jgi:uncharacterized protein
MGPRPWTQAANGVVLEVRVTPRSAGDSIEGIEQRADGRAVLKARVRAAPAEGAANEALRQFIAKALGVAPRQIDIAAGATARVKRLRITGDVQTLNAMLERVIKAGP